jgi:hypothetical protein
LLRYLMALARHTLNCFIFGKGTKYTYIPSPLPSGTLATFFLTAEGPIQHTNEDDIGREKTILMT